MTLKIDVLHSKDCTDWEEYVRLVDEALAEMGLEAEYEYILVKSDRDAMEHHFIGSPTIRLNGQDLFPAPGAASGMRLRSYFTSEGMVGHPTYGQIYEAIQKLV